MKKITILLVIIFTFLLLSSPVIGDSHKGETLFRWETTSGQEWKGFGDKDTQPKYQGQVKDGKPNGQGTSTEPDGGKYEGGHKEGNFDGQGTWTEPDGSKYVGEWKDGLPNGQGTETFPDGTKYVGEYKDDKRWNGIYYNQNGNILEKWVNGR